MNWKRKGLNPKNEILNEKFFSLELDVKSKLVSVTENVLAEPRFKNMEENDVVRQLWNNKTNAQKRCILKSL
jgi:hypothetical protein